MVTHAYINVHRKGYDIEDGEKPFVLSMAEGGIYACRDIDEEQLRRLRDDITGALDDHSIGPRQIEWGDVYRGTNIIDPNDPDIPF